MCFSMMQRKIVGTPIIKYIHRMFLLGFRVEAVEKRRLKKRFRKKK